VNSFVVDVLGEEDCRELCCLNFKTEAVMMGSCCSASREQQNLDLMAFRGDVWKGRGQVAKNMDGYSWKLLIWLAILSQLWSYRPSSIRRLSW